jgi:GT2 family glycosyltransferase
MSFKETISVIVGCRNNVDYTQHFYKRFRQLYPEVELVFISYGSTDDTAKFFGQLQEDNNTITFHNDDTSKTFSDTYNMGVYLANNPWVVFCHNDQYVLYGFLEELYNYTNDPNTVVGYTNIEPPVFGKNNSRYGCLVHDGLGTDFQTIKSAEVESLKNKYINAFNSPERQQEKVVDGAHFFSMINRDLFMELGGFDNYFNPFFCEDDDLQLRLKLYGCKQIIVHTAMCYHFVSKTSRFSEEYEKKTKEINVNSNWLFYKKWGFLIDSKYHTSYAIWVDPDSIFSKFSTTDDKQTADILVQSYGAFTETDKEYLTKLSDIIWEAGILGKYRLGNLIIEVKSLYSRSQSKIFLKNFLNNT